MKNMEISVSISTRQGDIRTPYLQYVSPRLLTTISCDNTLLIQEILMMLWAFSNVTKLQGLHNTCCSNYGNAWINQRDVGIFHLNYPQVPFPLFIVTSFCSVSLSLASTSKQQSKDYRFLLCSCTFSFFSRFQIRCFFFACLSGFNQSREIHKKTVQYQLRSFSTE
jgi:hypothetical protein